MTPTSGRVLNPVEGLVISLKPLSLRGDGGIEAEAGDRVEEDLEVGKATLDQRGLPDAEEVEP